MNRTRLVFLLVFGSVTAFLFVERSLPGLIVFVPLTVIGYLFTSDEANAEMFDNNDDNNNSTYSSDGDDSETDNVPAQAALTYIGSQLDFTDEYITDALIKYIPYYNLLSFPDKHKFLIRVKTFMKSKTFVIHDNTGFKEMPILTSAAAVQLTFGLEQYVLPYFPYIHIFPDAFARQEEDKLCFLEGNVSGNSINIAWTYFLEGFQNSSDGKNVGLHEMSHALYYQTMVADKGLADADFSANYRTFDNYGDKVFNDKKDADGVLFNDYAFKNIQEFWAQSVELFFERGKEMQTSYPELYKALTGVLKQDPANNKVSIGDTGYPG